MVSNNLLYYIHLRLDEIFGTTDIEPFPGLTILAVGDFFQLSAVGGLPGYSDYKSTWKNLNSFWKLFKMIQLTEVMCQHGDPQLIHLLNNVRTANLNSHKIYMIHSRIIQPEDANNPKDALHIYAENANANSYNQAMLESIDIPIYYIKAIDNLPKNVSIQKINEVLNRNQSETGVLAGILKIKINARVMLTVNIFLQDRLVNGQLGTVMHITGNSQKYI